MNEIPRDGIPYKDFKALVEECTWVIIKCLIKGNLESGVHYVCYIARRAYFTGETK